MTFALWDIAQSKYSLGTKVTVKVLTVSNDAAVVEIQPGLKGVIARKDLSWDYHTSPTAVLTVGQQIEVLVCGLDSNSSKISLSRRLLEPDPWETVETLYPVGSTVSGKVINLVDFGAFIALPRGIDGLLHLNDMSWGTVRHPSALLTAGQELDLLVLDVRKERKRMNLGLKQRCPNPWDNVEANYPVGTKVKGKVVNLVPYGAFVEIEPGVEGLLHATELSWTKKVVKPSDVLNKGQEIEALVLGINRQERKISLSLRQLEPHPWDKVQEKYPPGTRIRGKVRNLTSYGAFIELDECLDGMLHVCEMSWTRKISHPSEVIKKGEELEAVVLEVDKANQRIALGMKQLTPDPWESIETYYQVGNIITGTVAKLSSFGAFVPLAHEIDGLIRISEISEERIDKIKNVLQVGQEITARVISIDKAERRIGLSIKAAKGAP
jgi:small subunit ribosomal protein S1